MTFRQDFILFIYFLSLSEYRNTFSSVAPIIEPT
jgi:hypothetical protein